MSDPFIAEIRILGCNFAPRGWAMCNGQLLPISQNTALFSLLGTNYGGNGKTNFALPNLQGSAPVNQGQTPNGDFYSVGTSGGSAYVTLTSAEMPRHSHGSSNNALRDLADTSNPQGAVFARTVQPTYTSLAPNVPLANTLTVTGSGLPHNNMQPYLVLNFCIALQGTYPQRP